MDHTLTLNEQRDSWTTWAANSRDELNLASFPISVLQRQQPLDDCGKRKEEVVFRSSCKVPGQREPMEQTVTLTGSSKYGLPTPADENVILGLLCIAKHTNNFTEQKVHFSPRQLFSIMGWSANSRSYERLLKVFERLMGLTVWYKNAWWDAESRSYVRKVGVKIIVKCDISWQTSGEKKGAKTPPSFVQWSDDFYESVRKGYLRDLNLEILFRLRPGTQRMYRYLRKRFYNEKVVDLDLREFACGNVGFRERDDVGRLKQQISPCIKELEDTGVIEKASECERYRKVSKGVWRIIFRQGPCPDGKLSGSGDVPPLRLQNPPKKKRREGDRKPVVVVPPAENIVQEYHRLRFGVEGYTPLEKEVAYARGLIAEHGETRVRLVLSLLVGTMKKQWSGGRTFVAVKPYFAEVLEKHKWKERQAERQEQQRQRKEEDKHQNEEEHKEEARFMAEWRPVWDRCLGGEREEILAVVREQRPSLFEKDMAVRQFARDVIEMHCLKELARRRMV